MLLIRTTNKFKFAFISLSQNVLHSLLVSHREFLKWRGFVSEFVISRTDLYFIIIKSLSHSKLLFFWAVLGKLHIRQEVQWTSGPLGVSVRNTQTRTYTLYHLLKLCKCCLPSWPAWLLNHPSIHQCTGRDVSQSLAKIWCSLRSAGRTFTSRLLNCHQVSLLADIQSTIC